MQVLIISEVAPIAQGEQVLISAVRLVIVFVGHRQHDFAPGIFGRLTIHLSTSLSDVQGAFTGTLALSFGPFVPNS